MWGHFHTKVRPMVIPCKWLLSRTLQKRQPLYLVIVSSQRRENPICEVQRKGSHPSQREEVMLLTPCQQGMLTKCLMLGQFLQQGNALSNPKHLSGLINLRNTPRCREVAKKNITIV